MLQFGDPSLDVQVLLSSQLSNSPEHICDIFYLSTILKAADSKLFAKAHRFILFYLLILLILLCFAWQKEKLVIGYIIRVLKEWWRFPSDFIPEFPTLVTL